MTRLAKTLCIIGSVLLLVTAMFHGTGYSGVSDAISASNAAGFLKRAVPGLWAHFSIHLVVLAAFGILVSFFAHRGRILIVLLTLAVAADAVLVFSLAGFFAGVALLIAAAVCFAGAAIQRSPATSRSHGVGT